MENATEANLYQDYIKSRAPEFIEILGGISEMPEEDIKFGSEGALSKLREILAFVISPSINERQSQLMALGLRPEQIVQLDLNGGQSSAAANIVENLPRLKARKSLATNLKAMLERK